MKKNLFLAALILAASAIYAAGSGESDQQKEKSKPATEELRRPPRPPHHPRRPPGREEFINGPGIWRAFAQMAPEEQKKMRDLQRTDPEKYRAVMRGKAEELFNAEQLRRKKIAEIVEKYNSSADKAEKTKLNSELKNIVRERFSNQLCAMRRDLERTRARVKRLEKELKKREANSEAIIDAMTRRHLDGKSKKTHRESQK